MAQLEIKHYKVRSLPVKSSPNSVYYVLEQIDGQVKTYITDLNGYPIPLIDETTQGVLTVAGTGVTGSALHPRVEISTFVSGQLGNQVHLSLVDGKLQVNPITSPNGSIEINSTSTELQIQLSSAIASEIASSLQPGDNISELTNDVGYITAAEVPPTITNLQSIASSTNVVIDNDNGTDATILAATTVNAGVLLPSDKIKLNNTTNVNSGDQTSIVGISGTKSQYNTSLTDGDFLFVGDVVGYTDEQAQDAIGSILTDTATIDFTYNDIGNAITADVKSNSITATQLADNINISEFVNNSGYLINSNFKTLEGQSLIGSGNIDLNKSDVGLVNVDNTSDLNKPISTATQTALNLKEDKVNKGVSNGYASLDSGGKIPASQLPNSVMELQGFWNATTNTPTLTNGIGNPGDVWECNVAGTSNFGAGNIPFKVGDWAVYTATGIWEKSINSNEVTSVFGRTGTVVATNGDYTTALVPETTNKNYQTDNQKLFNDATSSIQTQLNLKANLASPIFTGNPTAPTPTAGDNDTSVATTAFVTNAITSAGVSLVPNTRTININGVTQDLSANRQWRAGLSNTGVLTYAGISTASTTQINIGAVTGIISDNETVPGAPDYVLVNYAGATNVTVPTIAGGTGTYVLLDKGVVTAGVGAGALVFQNTFPTSAQRKSMIYLSKISHPNSSTISFSIDEPDFVTSPLQQFRDLFQVFGYTKKGILPTGNAGLTINTTNGVLTGDGINFVTSRTTPNDLAIAAGTPRNFLLLNQSGVVGSFITAIDPTTWDNAGTTTTVGGGTNRSTIQYLYYAPGVGFAIQRGQTIYATLTDAVAAVGKESFITRPNLIGNSILVAVICLRHTTTNMNDTNFARVLPTDMFGQVGGASAGISVTNLQTAYGNGIQPQITTTVAGGAVVFQRGTAADTDNVFEVRNGAGTANFSVNGSGRAVLDSIRLTTTPTTSTGGYDIITRNTSNGLLEKVSSTVIGTLQTAYNNSSSSPQITLNGTNGTFGIRNNAGGIFNTQEWRDNTGAIKAYIGNVGNAYFDNVVRAAELQVTNSTISMLNNFSTILGGAANLIRSNGHVSVNSASTSFGIAELNTSNLTTARNFIFPDQAGTFALTTTSIQNQNASAQTANMWISGSGQFGDKVTINGVSSASKNELLRLIKPGGFGDTRFYQNYSNTFFTNGKSLEIELETLPMIQLAIDNGATAGKVIFPNGNVGIGTPNPLGTLETRKDINGENTIIFSNRTHQNSANPAVGLRFQLGDISEPFKYGAILYKGDGTFEEDASMRFYTQLPQAAATAPLERMRITSGGNVGIGTTNPNVKLDVVGNGKFTGQGFNSTPTSNGTNANFIDFKNTGGDFYLGQESSTNGGFFNGSIAYDNIFYGGRPYNFIINGASRLYIKDDGNISIGTTSPLTGGGGAKWLTLEGTTTYGGGIISSINGVAKGLVYSEGGSLLVQGNTGEGVKLVVNGTTNAVNILNNGNVGIGTTNSLTTLNVNKTSQSIGSATPAGGFLLSDKDNTSYSLEMGTNVGSGPWIQSRSYTAATMYQLAINPSGGNVLMGTATNNGVDKLQVNGSISTFGDVTSQDNGIPSGQKAFKISGLSEPSTGIYGSKVSIQSFGFNGSSYVYREGLAVNANLTITVPNLSGVSTRTVLADATGVLSAPVSDETLKENIQPLHYGLNEVMKMNPVSYNFKDREKYGDGLYLGNLAQDMEKIIPEAVFTDTNTGKMGIEYSHMHAVYIKAIQEQQNIIDKLLSRIEKLETK